MEETIDELMRNICDDLEQNAMPFEQWSYSVKETHQIIRRHISEFVKNNY